MVVSKPLLDTIRDGRAFLFLGAGASIGGIHPKNIQSPSGQKLADKIAKKFLGDDFIGKPLPQVTELAISEADLLSVQQFIASLFFDYQPADFHKMIPRFTWSGIATTNIDLILERAYDLVNDRLQTLVVFKKDGERVEEKLRSTDNVIYLKLHGCITYLNDKDLPLILTPDQYITHRSGRKRLFEKFQNYAYEYPIIFVGYSLSDIDIRAILNEISQLSDARPRSYIVTPTMTPQEVRFWESKKITHIQLSFKDFMLELDDLIPQSFRSLLKIINNNEHPIQKHFQNKDESVASDNLIAFLTRNVDYIHRELKTVQPDPIAFYKGYFNDWAPIINDLDVKRSLSDEIITEVFLPSEGERRGICEFYLIKGHAGSGKSVMLKRIAWDVSVGFDKLCLFSKQSSLIEYEYVAELYRLCQERIFLFLDNACEYIDTIEDIILKARKDKIPLTIISAERESEWNTRCESLYAYLTDTYMIQYLSEKEIEGLITLLARHKSLGYLEGKSLTEQKNELALRAGRQLLVALHEATMGKPFADIVYDEYKSISPLRAQSLYLTICIFHRLGVSVRAGLISRVHGIPFSVFAEELFKPLEFIVFAQVNNIIDDYEYRSRHQHIAEIVFERALTDAQDRFDEYVRILNAIDVDYSSDREALKGITNARELLELFHDPQMIKQIYSIAEQRDEENPMLIQQEALFEMHSRSGSLEKANELLKKAHDLAPYNRAIAHSLSELALKRAEQSTSELEKSKYRNESKIIAESLISRNNPTSHAYHTLIKIDVGELKELIDQNDTLNIERKIKETEANIVKALQLFPDDEYLLTVEADFCNLIRNHTQALNALEKAFSTNKRSPYLASRLAKVYVSNGRIDDAVNIMKQCLDENPSDKNANFYLATLLEKLPHSNNVEIRHYLRRSFTTGDSNYAAQFWYARILYIDGEREGAKEIFLRLSDVNIDIRVKQEPRGIIYEAGNPKRFSGIVNRVETTYAFITRDFDQDSIYTRSKYNEKNEWAKLKYHKRVTFQLGYNYRGPFAIDIKGE